MNRVDIAKVYRENMKPGLASHEALCMDRAISAPPLRSLVTEKDGQFFWYVLDSSLPRAKRHGVASSEQEAQDIIARLLGTGSTTETFRHYPVSFCIA